MPRRADPVSKMAFDVVAGLRNLGKLAEQLRIAQYIPRGARDGLDAGGSLPKKFQGSVGALAADAHGRGAHQRTRFLARPETERAHERLIRTGNVLHPVGFFSHVSSLGGTFALSGIT